MDLVRYPGIFFLILVAACSPKSLQTSSIDNNYYEDLSLYRPSYYHQESSADEQSETSLLKEILIENDHTAQVDTLLEILAAQNQTLEYVQGFTVQIYSGNSRKTASKARMDVFKVLIGFEPEIKYVQPNFKVKVGKFIDRLEAQWVYAQLKPAFPRAIIVPERIRLTD